MFGPLVLIVILALAWRFAAPGAAFLPGFARLLTRPVILRSPLSMLSGRSEATGSYRARAVVATLQLKRGTHGIGSLTVAMRTTSPASLDGAGVDRRVRDDTGRRALFALAVEEVMLTHDPRCLKAIWCPQGFTVFPGTFDQARWARVLDAMDSVAASLGENDSA